MKERETERKTKSSSKSNCAGPINLTGMSCEGGGETNPKSAELALKERKKDKKKEP